MVREVIGALGPNDPWAIDLRSAPAAAPVTAEPADQATVKPRTPPALLALIGFLLGGETVAAVILLPHATAWPVAAVAVVLVAFATRFTVPAFGNVPARWSVAGFLHLFFAIAIGPAAIFTTPIAHVVGTNLTERRQPIRSVFNVTNHTATSLVVWASFNALAGRGSTNLPLILLAACTATTTQVLLSGLLVALARRATEGPISWIDTAASAAAVIPYHLAFGLAAGGGFLLYQHWGLLGFVTTLAPIAGIQATLIAERNVQVKRQEERAAYQKERELLLQRALDAQEQERDRIAADLHDGVIQELVTLLYSSDSIQHHLDAPDQIKTYTDRVATVSRQAVRDLRELMTDLAPPRLEQDGLERTLGQDLDPLEEEQHIRVHLACDGTDQLAPRAMRLIHRVVMEATRNAVKHAECENLWVNVSVKEDRAVAQVRDDGRGFTEAERAEIQSQGHNGLGLLEKTVTAGGGNLEISSQPGTGTTVRLRLPILS